MEENKEFLVSDIFIELELVIDIYSLLFSIIRINLLNGKNVHISNKDISNLYGKSLRQGTQDLLASVASDKFSTEEIDEFINTVQESFTNIYSSTLKPTVPTIHVINELNKNQNCNIHLFSHIDLDSLNQIMEAEFAYKFASINSFDQFLKLIQEKENKNCLIIFGSRNQFKNIQNVITSGQIELINIKLPMENEEATGALEFNSLDLISFENYGLFMLTPCYEGSLQKFDLNKDLNTPELEFWGKTISLKDIKLTGKIVHGFQRGSKQLGVPTCNIEMTQENIEKINQLLPGVYAGTAQFIENTGKTEAACKVDTSQIYKTAISIGWNPTYDCVERTIEAYLLEEFSSDFYDEQMTIEITNFIRAESNYSSLDHLIMAIHNDIETTKQIVQL